ncbi:MAG TPA: histidine phosphatase family protein [Pyrinomonadaceae bacterium]|nr:histidine phosphatase family protein [Pyrinomonadaceae bacterium]
MSLLLHFLRHGQTPYSRDDSFCGSGLDPELTAEGREMAEAVAAAYGETPWRAIYSSPAKRALMTAEPLRRAVGMEVRERPGLREIGYGRWEGLTPEIVDREYHDDYLRWQADPAWNAPTGGELAVAIARRGLEVVEEIKAEFADGNVLIVSHKATIRIILCGLLGIDVGRFRYRLLCPVGSISVVEFSHQGPLLRALADRTHLTERLRSLPGT